MERGADHEPPQQDKELRRQERLAAEAVARADRRERIRNRAFWGIGVTLAGGLLVAAFALPARDTTRSAAPAAGESGGPVAPGQAAPDFRARDVVSGRSLTLNDLRGRETLLFFNEGANCQACMVQAAELEASEAFARTGIELVSITNDPPDDLAQVAAQYGITTPLLADDSRAMTGAYGSSARRDGPPRDRRALLRPRRRRGTRQVGAGLPGDVRPHPTAARGHGGLMC